MSTYVFAPDNSPSETLYDLSSINNKNPKADDFKAIIKSILLAKDDSCYREMEVYLRAPGITGSRSFDQGMAVNVLLKHDFLLVNPDSSNSTTLKTGTLRAKMNGSKTNEREIWDKLVSVLRGIGMRFKHGRLIGAIGIEDQDQDDSGSPDID